MNRVRLLLVVLSAVLVLAACHNKITGMGWMRSAVAFTDPSTTERATIGFALDTDDLEIQGSYQDHAFTINGFAVRLTFTGVLDEEVPIPHQILDLVPPEANCVGAKATYQPSASAIRAMTGLVEFVVCDINEPGINQDALFVHLASGAFAGYTNFGLTQGGNIQGVH